MNYLETEKPSSRETPISWTTLCDEYYSAAFVQLIEEIETSPDKTFLPALARKIQSLEDNDTTDCVYKLGFALSGIMQFLLER